MASSTRIGKRRKHTCASSVPGTAATRASPNLWPNYDPALGVDYFAGYDLFIPNWWPEAARPLDRLRVVNPALKFCTQNATYGWPGSTR